MYNDIFSMPVFVKEGSIIPLSVLEKDNQWQNPRQIEVLIYGGKNNSFTLYEDDGLTNDYKNGESYQTFFNLKYTKKSINLSIRTSGNPSLIPQDRELILKFINIEPNTVIKKNIRDLIEVNYNEENKILTIRISNQNIRLQFIG